ncbi:M protein [Helicobacter pylori]
MGSFFSLGKSSNDTQENPKDALKKEEELKKVQEENAELKEENTKLNRERTDLITEKDNLTNQLNASQKQVKELEQSQQVLKNEKAELSKDKDDLTTEKENLTTALSAAKTQAEQTSQKLNELEQRHAPYQKLEKLYEVFLEVKDRLNFNFVATTHSTMDLIASVLSDSKYYLESLYNKASQELSDKRSDKGEKLTELFDSLFEYIKDSKFERLKEPSAYDHSCKKLYPEQNTSQKMQRVVLRGYTYDKKIACYTIVDMGS